MLGGAPSTALRSRMCRFVAYKGHPVVLSDLLYRPRHSLVAQSSTSEEMSQTFNGDGFGVGWYAPEIDAEPCVLKAAVPAWSSTNARSVSTKIRSSLVFAHIRAASPGMGVQQSNCHPFASGPFLFMHNGSVDHFARLRRRLQQGLSDRAFDAIQGTTDAEHAFAVFLDLIGEPGAPRTVADLRKALVATIARLAELARAVDPSALHYLNFAVTDGAAIVVSRYASSGKTPASLHFSAGSRYVVDGEDGDMLDTNASTFGAVMVASEPLTRRPEDWKAVPENHTLTVDAGLRITLDPIVL
jgi:predicted glutamine amidotransferase